ncbi:MAG: ScyD/ScyE family protein [Chloroflexota bacterium]
MMRKTLLIAWMLALLSIPLAVSAQDGGVLADGLNAPRAIFFDANGALWIAEAGAAGDQTGDTENGPVNYGGSARVLVVEPGDSQATVVLGGLPSASGFDDVIGVNSLYADEEGLWLVTGLGPLADPFNMAVINLDPETLRVKRFIDMYSYELEYNPDGDIVVSNPGDIASDGNGTYFIVDVSGNSLMTWTESGDLDLFHAWEDLPVPTSVAVAPDGSVYVGFLSAFPFAQGSARVEHWSADKELLETFDGLTGVTDVLVAEDGTVYAVQLASEFGDLGWTANSGSVVTVSADGITPVAEGLNYPYGLAISPTGDLAVTINSTFSGEGSGQVLALSGDVTVSASSNDGEDSSSAEAPAETPEAPAETPEAESVG